MRERMREAASGCVVWVGLALIGVVAVPTGLLFGVIYLIWKAMSFLTDRLQ